MCAITGLIARGPGATSAIQAMTTLLRHRGPDDEGYVSLGKDGAVCLGGPDTPSAAFAADIPFRPTARIDAAPQPGANRLAFGHRRLSIVDLSPLGHQPMFYADRYWMVYNGEVYNHVELRKELEAAGCRFRSHSDTEVILAAYARWGVECFARFNGMWALAIYDSEQDTFVLSRDRFGVKPLYYWMSGETFAFASEIKAFTVLPDWQARANGQAVHDFLVSGLQDHSGETIFAGVRQIEPGTYATFNCGEWLAARGEAAERALVKRRWYELTPRPFAGTFEDACGRFRELLTDAVALRLRSDVPVGSCLSGGLDSSAIVCTANQLLRQQAAPYAQKTFSACSEIKRFDERDYIEKVVAATGVESHYCFPSADDLFAHLDEMIWHQDEPFGSTSIFAQWTVFASAHQHAMKVMLDGQGADEMLYGYDRFRRAFLGGLVRSGQWGDAWQEAGALRGDSGGAFSWFARALRDAATPAAVRGAFRQFAKNRRPPEWLSRTRLQAACPGPLATRFNRSRNAQELSLEMLTGAHVQMLLHWEDRNSMAHSIEARVPFLDYRLVEFVVGLPDRFKIRGGVTKAVLREGMKNVVPEAVLQRRDKMGFVTPEQIWAKQTHTPQFRQGIADAVSASEGVLTPAAREHFEAMFQGRIDYDASAWRLICFGRWLRKFSVTV